MSNRTAPGQSWTVHNIGKRIKFGGTEAVVMETTSATPLAKCKKLGLFKPYNKGAYQEGLWSDTFINPNSSVDFRQMLPQPRFWITTNSEIATVRRDSSIGVIFKSKTYWTATYPLDNEIPLDVNVFKGRIWVSSVGDMKPAEDPDRKKKLRLLTGLVTDSFLTELDSISLESLGADYVLLPCFNSDCSVLKCGGYTNTPDVPGSPNYVHIGKVREYTLTPDGTISNYLDYDWDLDYAEAPSTNVPPSYVDIPDLSAISSNKITFLYYPTRLNNTYYNVGATVHGSNTGAYYVTATQAGVSASSAPATFFQLFIPDSGVDTLADGGVVWQRGAGLDSNFSNSVETWPVVNPSVECNASGEPSTLEDELAEIGSGDPNFSHYELLEGPTQFLNEYPKIQYYNSYTEISPHPFRRSAKVRIWRDPDRESTNPEFNPQPSESFIYTYRWSPYYEVVRISGANPSSLPTAPAWYTGAKPLGWVRSVDSGLVEEITAVAELPETLEGNYTGIAGGFIGSLQVYGFGTTTGSVGALPPPLDILLGFCAALPDPQGYSYSWVSNQSGAYLETVKIGSEPQYSVRGGLNSDQTLQSSYTGSSSATVQRANAPTAPTNVWAGYKNLVKNSNSSYEYRLVEKMLVAGNLQARFYYVVSHKHTSPITGKISNVSTYTRERIITYKGNVVWSEEYQAATSAYNKPPLPTGSVGSLKSVVSSISSIAPVGKGSGLGFLMVLKDWQGESNTWGTFASVISGRYTILIDSNGVLYDYIPLAEGGQLDITENYNDTDDYLYLHLK